MVKSPTSFSCKTLVLSEIYYYCKDIKESRNLSKKRGVIRKGIRVRKSKKLKWLIFHVKIAEKNIHPLGVGIFATNAMIEFALSVFQITKANIVVVVLNAVNVHLVK